MARTVRLVAGSGIGRAALVGVAATFRIWGRVLHLLWLEITGLFFIIFAGLGAIAAAREYRLYTAGQAPLGHVLAIAGFAILFAHFGVSSFWRARRKQR